MPISVDQLRDIVGPSGYSPRQMEELRQRAEDESLPSEDRQAAREAYQEAVQKEWAATRQQMADFLEAQLAPMAGIAANLARALAGTQNILKTAAVGDNIARVANAMAAAIPPIPPIPSIPTIPTFPPLPPRPLPVSSGMVPHTAQDDSQSDWEESRMAGQWEYNFFEADPMSDDDDETQFNMLGEQGWELVGVVPDVRGEVLPNKFGHVQGETVTLVKYVFKRRKP